MKTMLYVDECSHQGAVSVNVKRSTWNNNETMKKVSWAYRKRKKNQRTGEIITLPHFYVKSLQICQCTRTPSPNCKSTPLDTTACCGLLIHSFHNILQHPSRLGPPNHWQPKDWFGPRRGILHHSHCWQLAQGCPESWWGTPWSQHRRQLGFLGCPEWELVVVVEMGIGKVEGSVGVRERSVWLVRCDFSGSASAVVMTFSWWGHHWIALQPLPSVFVSCVPSVVSWNEGSW